MSIRHFRHRTTALAGVALACTLALGGCAGTGSSGANSGDDASDVSATTELTSKLPQEIQDRGSIKVASNVEYPPFEYYGEDNTTIIGLDKDLADELSKRLGVKLEFNNMSFDSIIPALKAKRFDMAMSAMTDNEDRRKEVDFVDYFQSGGGFLVKAGNPKGIQTLGDLCGLTAAIDKGTTEIEDADRASKECTDAGKPPVKADVYPGTSKIVLALQNGRADVALIDTSAAAYISKQNEGKFEVPSASYAPRRYGVVLPKGSDKLAAVLQEALQSIVDDGTYTDIVKKWGQDTGAIDKVTVNDGEGLS
jgi:polar amino acid transport system substrate-binding protein